MVIYRVSDKPYDSLCKCQLNLNLAFISNHMVFHIPSLSITLHIPTALYSPIFYIFGAPLSVILAPFMKFCLYWSQKPIWEYNSFHYGCYLLASDTHWRSLNISLALFSSILSILYIWHPLISFFSAKRTIISISVDVRGIIDMKH